MAEHLSRAELSDVMELALSDEQWKVATAPLGPSVVVAGAGTGKTTVMAARVVWLVGMGQVQPAAVLGLTFTRRAAGELGRKIEGALNRLGVAGDDGPQVSTYDAFVGQLLDEHGLRLGFATGRLMTGAEPYQLADQAADDPGFDPIFLRQIAPATVADHLLQLDRAMAAHLVDADALRASCQAFSMRCAQAPGPAGGIYQAVDQATRVALQRQELVGFVERYRQLKADNCVAEFGDQQMAATRLADRFPAVGAALRQRFQVVLLDEYQDTSGAQAAMLGALFSGPNRLNGRGFPVCAVGDPRQAIYGWRGAAADNMGDFFRLFPMPDASPPPVYDLAVNRRSGSAIVAAANQVASGLHVVGGGAPLAADPDLAAGRIEVSSFMTWPDEVAAMAARVVQARRLGEAAAWSDIAVLLRRNRDIPAFYRALTDLGAPAEIVGLSGLLALPEVAAIVAMMRLAVDDSDNPAAALLVAGPACALGPSDMAALAHRARELAGVDASGATLLDAVFDPGPSIAEPARDRLRHLAASIRAVRRQRHQPATDLMRTAAEQLGLVAELDVPSVWSSATGTQVRRFFAEVTDHVGRTGAASPASVLIWLRDEALHGGRLDQATPSEANSVKLLTVHRAKGLEWQVVVLPALNTGVFPNDRVNGNPLTRHDALPFELRLDADSLPRLGVISPKGFKAFEQELKRDSAISEDRLAYVAVSRAKSLLIASASHWRPGAKTARQASRLFETLLEQAVSSGGRVALAPPPGAENPLAAVGRYAAWPVTLDAEQQQRLDAAAAAVGGDQDVPSSAEGLSAEDAARLNEWRVQTSRLIAEASGSGMPAPMPGSVSASALMSAHRDPASFFAEQARPMPRLMDESAVRGTQFHRWVQARFAAAGRLDQGTAPEMSGIADLVKAFEAGPYADRPPLGVEVPFVAVIAGQQVRGRIDAVYAGDGPYRFQIVDWKTSPADSADPVQLALYRLAWAQSYACRLDEVDAVFYHVGQNKVVRPVLVGLDQIEGWVEALRSEG